MKKKSKRELDDDLRPEYDFKRLTVVARGPGRRDPQVTIVHLAPDVAEVFSDDQAVNEALRLLIKIARTEIKPDR
jgi:hypothetical protein